MRIFSIISAILVAAVLYALVIERERLLAWVDRISPAETAAGAAPSETTSEGADALAPANAATESAQPGAGAVAVMAKHSIAREIDDAVILRGETEASREVAVKAEASGRVITSPIPKGSRVEADQLLCKLDPGTSAASLAEAEAVLAEARAQRPQIEARTPEAKAVLAQAEAQLEEARINLTAAEELSKGGYASRTRVASAQAALRSAEAAVSSAEAGVKSAGSGLDSLQAQVESAQAAVARAQSSVADLSITAPFGGVLESDTAELGSLMSVGAQCALILQLDPIKLVGYLPETDVARVTLGARAGARLTTGSQVVGEVTFVSRQADPSTRTFRVEITLPNPDAALRAGQTAEIGIEAEGALAHLLPQSALTLDDDGALGIRSVSEEGTAKFLPVTILRDTPTGVLVTGLPEAVDVITVGQEYVTDGVALAPSYEEVLQ